MATPTPSGIEINPFLAHSNGLPANWRLKVQVIGSVIQFDLYWADKESPTHTAVDDFTKFFGLLQAAQLR